MYHNMIPATGHLILLGAFSEDLLLLFVPTLAGNFLLLLEIEYLVDAQFDAVLVQDLQMADSAANVKALKMVVALRLTVLCIEVCIVSNKVSLHLQKWKIGPRKSYFH